MVVEVEYKGLPARLIGEAGANPGDRIRLRLPDGRIFEGLLMPRYSTSGDDIIVVKLGNGYNIGIRVVEGAILERISGPPRLGSAGAPAPLGGPPARLPDERVIVIGTGGTISSRIDYETGAVYPRISTDELLQAVPELYDIARVEVVELFSIFSEDMTPRRWERLANAIADAFNSGADGVVVAHGTDTMGYSAAAIAFAFSGGGPPGPIAFTGSQRSSDRPSSDSAFNIVSASLVAARAPFAESVVVMHGETGDTYALAHRGVRVRKMHTSRRDAFQSINSPPLARVDPGEKSIQLLMEPLWHRARGRAADPRAGFEPRVALIKHYPGMDGELIDVLVDRGYKGIVIEGTGFGHVSTQAIKAVRRAVSEGIPVVAASQCLFGHVNLNVYTTGRRMLAAGVIPAGDMLPETAYAKLSWLLGQGYGLREIRSLMTRSLAGEVSDTHSLRVYPRWYHG